VVREHPVHERLHLVLLADVAGVRVHPAVLGECHGLVERLPAAAAHDHPRAERGEL
jgi:hypothetical protein